MAFRHLLYLTALLCAFCQILLSLYARFYADIAGLIQAAALNQGEGELAVVKALNYVFPLGVACLAFQLYTWKINRVGGFAMLVALGLQAVAMDMNLRAVRHVFGENVLLATVTWWAPADDAVAEAY